MTPAPTDLLMPNPGPGPGADPGVPPVLEAHDLTRHYAVSRGLFRPPAQVQALNGVSLRLQAGRTLGVVGESGCGKSTLARLLTLMEPPTAGRLHLGGVDAVAAGPAERRTLRRQVQMVFQNPYASLNPRKRIGTALEEPLLLNTDLDAPARRERVAQRLEQVGLPAAHAARYPHMFSGGQRQRIAIARALMLEPPLLVADEPTSALDVSVQAQILNLLRDLQRDLGLACVFISHNLAVVEYLADEVAVMYLGRVVEHAPKARLLDGPRHPYSQALWSALPRLPDPARLPDTPPAADAAVPLRRLPLGEPPSPLNLPPGCAYASRCPLADARCRTERPELREIDGSGHRVACHQAG